MKPTLLALLTAALLASCAPKTESTETSTDGTTTTTTTDTGVAADSTLNNGDTANASEEADMAAGDGLEGMVMNFDGTAKTFGLNENDKNYNVSVTDTTTYEGSATTADEFFGTDRNDANVSVEGEINGESLVASKITLN
ncbi:hypothetical protein [Deinococcus actinosclerus]|uniref:DUF5666 domain-containing protein n=1 Tax=Deinococcus actinosclerus TaxID=1768108 RepID=A0ABM5X6A5_9DEIO|nr:hypothetical protein [Deinococcus actinosclerus]ALW89311.1 hypothetical protein AUC44_10730 [Deinococcus actinosclerus]